MERKTLYDISWQVSEEEYRADKAYSYSTISKFNREGFDNIGKLFDRVESPSLLFGSMVDSLLTGGQEEFDERFEVAELPDISDTLSEISRTLFNQYGELYRSLELIPDSIIAQVGEEAKYYAGSKYASFRVKKIKESCTDYYNLLSISSGKTLVSNKEYQDALYCVEALRTNNYTKWYFAPNSIFEPNIERFYQLKFKGSWQSISLRIMADLIIVDHDKKVIIPCDLKTSSKKEWSFHKSFVDWGYWIQAQLYWYIIRQNLDKDDLYKDYELLDYRFIVANRYNKKPLVWEYPDTKSIQDCFYGKNNQIVCRNWRNIVQDLNYYLTCTPEYPIGIVELNDIVTWLNKE